MITGPLFKWFGSKWLSSKTLPKPEYDSIVEPFAGSAGYSLRHHQKNVVLYESDPYLFRLWDWLIKQATEKLIRQIPIRIKEGTDIRSLQLSDGQSILLKSWQRTNNIGHCWTISPWGNLPGQWTENTRARVAEQHQAVKHWQIAGTDGMKAFRTQHPPVTWFVDPPYLYNYQYKISRPLDYRLLALYVKRSPGQKIVCEAACQKTNSIPAYLPFEFFGNRITSRRKVGENHHSKELIWESHEQH